MAAYNAKPYVGEAMRARWRRTGRWIAWRSSSCDDGSTERRPRSRGYARATGSSHAPGERRAVRRSTLRSPRPTRVARLLDADDAWPARQAARTGRGAATRPAVGLVYGDMRVVDASGAVLQESWLAGEPVIPRGRGGRRDARGQPGDRVLDPDARGACGADPREIPYTDWWFAARAALVSELAYVPSRARPTASTAATHARREGRTVSASCARR